VLLLEAGPADRALELHVPAAFSKLFRGRYDWNYDTVPQRELEGARSTGRAARRWADRHRSTR
jgi:choline dehydrogenase-like flavoprotein